MTVAGQQVSGLTPEEAAARLSGMVDEVQQDSITLTYEGKSWEVFADDLGVTMAQLSLAWVLKNPNVSTVITGASKVSQVEENMKAVEVKNQLTEDVMDRIHEIIKGIDD